MRACRQNPLIADRSSLIVDRQVGRYSYLLPYMWLGLCWWRRSVATIRPMVSLGSHGQANIRFRQIWFVTLLPPAASVRVVHCGEMSHNQQAETLNPHWATLLTLLARERALCAAPSTHLLASSVILSFLIISRHPLYLIILHRWSRNRAKACPASPWLGHPGGRVGNQEHTGDQSFLLLFISSQPLCLHS